ncbi:hypothetical protein H2201_003026 [Coniosporium apollinis]|uniref:Uncharacterized protein n=1 Tax=Coniosporium apollinis TaxID=61459 RepID=A0ABQ9P3D9_9PEZI|nr:hypothetical protein H2201_003026 [Coniosporium apollinis]
MSAPPEDNAPSLPDTPTGGKDALAMARIKFIKKRTVGLPPASPPPTPAIPIQTQQKQRATGSADQSTPVAGSQRSRLPRPTLGKGGSVARKRPGRPPKNPGLTISTSAANAEVGLLFDLVQGTPLPGDGIDWHDEKSIAALFMSVHGVPEGYDRLLRLRDDERVRAPPALTSKIDFTELLATANGESSERTQHELDLAKHRQSVAELLYGPPIEERNDYGPTKGVKIEKLPADQMADSDEDEDVELDNSAFHALHGVLKHTIIHELWSAAFDTFADPYYPVQEILCLRPSEIMAIEDAHRKARDDPTVPPLTTPTPYDVTLALEYLASKGLPSGLLEDWEAIAKEPMVDRFSPAARPRT